MKEFFIKDLLKGQELDSETFVLKSLNKKITKNGKEYWDLILLDKTGVISAKVWANAIPYCEDLENNTVVNVKATVEENMNGEGIQLFIQKMEKAEDFNKSDFIKSSKVEADELLARIEEFIKKIENPFLKQLLNNLFNNKEFLENFKISPAAEKAHHDFISGLMQHNLEMLITADSILEFYPEINKDILYTGIILHDIGKLEELKLENNIERTESGALLGHIYQGAEFINSEMNKIKDFPESLKNQIIHIILSHHGALEWGSPVKLQTIEAHLVHLVDKLSSQLQIVKKIIENNVNNDSDWSSFNNLLSSRLFLKNYNKLDESKNIEDNINVNNEENISEKNNNENNNLELPF